MSLIEYRIDEAVAIINLNRPETNNAQNPPLLEELDAAFERAASDRSVRVIVLNANGKHFSAGHDISPVVRTYEPWKSMFDDVDEVGLIAQIGKASIGQRDGVDRTGHRRQFGCLAQILAHFRLENHDKAFIRILFEDFRRGVNALTRSHTDRPGNRNLHGLVLVS